MLGQTVEHFPLCRVSCEVPDKGSLGRVPAKLFEAGLIVFQGKCPLSIAQSALALAAAAAVDSSRSR